MAARRTEPEREERITMEIVVDAYDAEEQRLGWYCYLENNLAFPFFARRRKTEGAAPGPGEEVEVVGMLPAEDCEEEMLVYVAEEGDAFPTPLEELEFVRADTGGPATEQAMADWRYWLDMGGSFVEDDDDWA